MISKLIQELVIQKDSDSDRKVLLNLRNSSLLGVGVDVVYTYSLGDESKSILYPKKAGSILYIGHANRNKEATGVRFGKHIATKKEEGADNDSNYALTQYYYNGEKLHLRIFKPTGNLRGKKLENHLIRLHVSVYGAQPIAQGTTGASYTANAMNKSLSEHKNLLWIFEH